MTFTDDDIERLEFSTTTMYQNVINPRLIRALISRMRAAEDVIWKTIALDDSIALGSSSDYATHNQIVEEARRSMENWRKACGK